MSSSLPCPQGPLHSIDMLFSFRDAECLRVVVMLHISSSQAALCEAADVVHPPLSLQVESMTLSGVAPAVQLRVWLHPASKQTCMHANNVRQSFEPP